MNWDIEAPNVVTEARFRELVESGYSAEILCQESAHKKGPSYYGVWIMRVVSDDGVEKLLVTARTRTTYNDIKIREFFPEEGPSAERCQGYRFAKKLSSFWKAVSGDIKVPNRRLIAK